MDIKKINEAFDHLADAQHILSDGPRKFYLKKLSLVYEEFFKRCSPYKIGDKVELIKRPNTDNGWRAYKDLLVVGAEGIVIESDYDEHGFSFNVEIDYEGRSCVFALGENYLRISSK